MIRCLSNLEIDPSKRLYQDSEFTLPRALRESPDNKEFQKGQKEMKGMIKDMNKEMFKKTVDAKAIEEWINMTLSETEDIRGVPTELLKKDARLAITRYGIDRFTLLNAGIPNDDITRLYNSLFVYTLGYLNYIKELVSNVSADNLGKESKHPTKHSIISAIWKVFQMLIEHAHKTDYELLITRTVEGLRQQVQDLLYENDQIRIEMAQMKEAYQHEIENLTVENKINIESLKEERRRRQIAEEELRRNIKTHEEEVGLRVKFEDRLNNLHSLHKKSELMQEQAR